MTRRFQFIQEARSMIGTPFIAGGRDAISGVDCFGLIVLAARNLGIELDVAPEVNRMWLRNWPRLDDIISKRCGRVMDGAADGDLLLFRVKHKWRHAPHVGIKTDVGVLHCHNVIGRVVEMEIDNGLARSLQCGYRIRELW